MEDKQYLDGSYSVLQTGARTAILLRKESCIAYRATRKPNGDMIYIGHGTQANLGTMESGMADLLCYIFNKRELLGAETLLPEEQEVITQWHAYLESNPDKPWRPEHSLESAAYLAQGRETTRVRE
jgi:hypothetical protein